MPQEILQKLLLNRMSIPEQEIREVLNTSNIDPNSGKPPTAPAFRSQPEVWSTDKGLLNRVKRLMQVAPELAGTIKNISVGPSESIINEILSRPNGKDFYDNYDGSNVVGAFTPRTRRMWISSKRPAGEQSATLVHEAGHAKGYLDHDDPVFKRLEMFSNDAYDPPMNYLDLAKRKK